MPTLLLIDTVENICSVALSKNDEIIAEHSITESMSHASMLTVLIDKLFQLSQINHKSIDAVAISKGPGSYTGLRIGVSVAKGICYGLDIPLIAVNTLHSLCYGAMENDLVKKILKSSVNPVLYCPMIDARRMEVYQQIFDINLNPFTETSAEIVSSNSFNDLLSKYKIIFFGSGSHKISKIISHSNAYFIDNILPLARFLVHDALMAYQNEQFEDLIKFEPFYLKNFVATKPKKNLL